MMNEAIHMINNRIILTVAVPTFNGEMTIGSMLEILLPQCTDKVEVLISDNCSTDRTPEIIKEFQKKYSFIKYVRNKENIGSDRNFLQCMRMALGNYVILISDDDIIIDGAIETILTFLEENPKIAVGYMESVAFKDSWNGLEKCHGYYYLPSVKESITTLDKKVFFRACTRLFGFTSSFVYSTERIHSIENPERFFGTYFLQAYILICCSSSQDAELGIIKGPCIAIGEYGQLGNYDVALVEGIYYHRVVDFAVEKGYDRKLFEKWYIWKFCHLCREWLIKQRAVGIHQMSIKNMFQASWKYPKAWITLYPFILLPGIVCKWILKFIRIRQGRNYTSYIKRATEE